jgi:hypothetical protein
VASSDHNSFAIWDAPGKEPRRTFSVPTFVRQCNFTADGAILAMYGSGEGRSFELLLIEFATGLPLYRHVMPPNFGGNFTVLGDGRRTLITDNLGLGVICPLRPAKFAEGKLATSEKIEAWWQYLDCHDGPSVYEGIWSLGESGDEVVEFIDRQLQLTLAANEPARSNESLRVSRAAHVLGRIGTDRACAVLKRLAGGKQEHPATKVAAGALAYLRRKAL